MDSYPPMIAETPQEQARFAVLRKKHAQPGQLDAATMGLDPWAQLVQQAQGPVNPNGPMTRMQPPIRPGMLDAATAGMGPPPNHPPQVAALRSPQAGAMMSAPPPPMGQQSPPPAGAPMPGQTNPSQGLAQLATAPDQQKLLEDQLAQSNALAAPDTSKHYGWAGGAAAGLGNLSKGILGSIKANALRSQMQQNLQQKQGNIKGAMDDYALSVGGP